MILAQDTLMSETFVSNANTVQHEAAAVEASFQALDAYDLFEPPPEVGELIVQAFADISRNETDAKAQVSGKLKQIDEKIDQLVRDTLVDKEEESFLFAAFGNDDADDSHLYETRYLFEATSDNGDRRIGGIGVLGAMITIYNEDGSPQHIDEPVTWAEYLKSPDKAAWTETIITEVQKLEDADGGRGTWIKVPRAAAKGHVVHKTKIVFKVKTDSQKRYDKRKARFVVVGSRMLKGRDYLEKFTQGAALGAIKMVMINVVKRKWIRFRIDIVNAFPQEDIEREIFMELPKGPFDWREPGMDDPIALCRSNLYGTPAAPRTFTVAFHNHLVNSCQMKPGLMDNKVYSKGDETDGVQMAGYMDELFGGASSLQRADWMIQKVKERYPITVEFDFGTVLGFGTRVTEDNFLEFGTRKYAMEIKDRFLKGESKPTKKTASRDSIMLLASEQPFEIGSPEEKANRHVQDEALALNGALTHLQRGRPDISIDVALCAQKVARATPAVLEHLKEIARYVWATEHYKTRHVGPDCQSLVLSPLKEPIRPYDVGGRIEYGLYAIGDANLAKPQETVQGSKSMGGNVIMFGGGIIEHKAYRFHTLTPDVCSCETMAASRLSARLIFFRGVAQHLGVEQVKPSPLFTDNDGTWHVATGGASVTSMVYIIRHVRFLQQSSQEEEITCYQIDGTINPADPLTKWLMAAVRQRHYLFLMGFPKEALEMWLASTDYKKWKPKIINKVAKDAPERPNQAIEHDKNFPAKTPQPKPTYLAKAMQNTD